MAGSAPLQPAVIHRPIGSLGVFLAASATEAQLESLQYFYQIRTKGEFTTASYTSFEEHAEDACVELERLKWAAGKKW